MLALSAAVGSGCSARDGGTSLAVDSAEVILGGRGSEEHVVPARVVVRTGGSVLFRTVDNRVHTITFQVDSLPPLAVDFLTRTQQLRSPPLVSKGTTFRIDLEGAPPGYYPFIAEGPGPPVMGALFIE